MAVNVHSSDTPRVGWKTLPLAALYDFKNGVNADRRAYGTGIPFINVLEPITFSHICDRDITGRVTLSDTTILVYEVCVGDLVFNRTSEVLDEVGLAAVYLGEGCVVFGGFVIRARALGNVVDSKFAAYALRAPKVRSQIIAMGQGAVRANIGQGNLRRVLLDIPPPAEQRAIAEALSDSDALIDSLEQLLTKKRQIKQGAMQELVTGKRRLPGFSREWRNKRLGDLLSIRHGRSQKQVERAGGDYPILATGGQIGWANAYLHDRPSVLIGRKGTIDQPRYMDTPFWSVDTLFYSEVFSPNVAKFLYYRFCLIDWKGHSEASGVPSLGAKVIESIEISCPDSDEQRAIADTLSDMDTDIAALEARLTKARDLKQAMAQALLTGRIRLVEART